MCDMLFNVCLHPYLSPASQANSNFTLITQDLYACYAPVIVDVRVAYIRKLAILGDRDHLVTANYSPVLCPYLWGPLDLNP